MKDVRLLIIAGIPVLRQTFRYWLLSFFTEPIEVRGIGFAEHPPYTGPVVILISSSEDVGPACEWIAGMADHDSKPIVVIPFFLSDSPILGKFAAIATVHTLEQCMPAIIGALGESVPFETSGGAITRRERQVLHLIAQGAPAKEISYRLGISRHTVVSYRRSLYLKTGARSLQQLALYAAMHDGET